MFRKCREALNGHNDIGGGQFNLGGQVLMSNAKEKDFFWQIQGATSFCKAKNDWLPYQRIHLSFVKHDGKDKGCKQLLAIEGSLKVHGADGALALYQLVVSGGLKALAAKSKNKAAANGSGNAEPIFKSVGGTTSERAKDGKCQFRQFSIIPGAKSDYTLVMMTCAGEQNATGGVQPVKGAQRSSIYVPMSSMDLIDMVTSMMAEYEAYRTAQMVGAFGNQPPSSATHSGSTTNESPAETTANESPTETTANESPAEKSKLEPVKETPELGKLLMVYDSHGFVNQGRPVVTQLSTGRKLLNSIVTQIAKQGYELQSTESMTQLSAALKEEKTGAWSLLMKKKGNAGEVTVAVIIDEIWEGTSKK